jgi:hypothetical protein
VADFRASKTDPKAGEGVAAGAGEGQGAGQGEGGGAQHGGGKVLMPEGVQLLGGEALLEEQEDGGHALLVPEGAFLKLTLPASPWVLAETPTPTPTLTLTLTLTLTPTLALTLTLTLALTPTLTLTLPLTLTRCWRRTGGCTSTRWCSR